MKSTEVLQLMLNAYNLVSLLRQVRVLDEPGKEP